MMNNSNVEYLKSVVGEKYFITSKGLLEDLGIRSKQGSKHPIGLIRPGNVDEISSIMKFCNEKHLKVTVRGGGSGVSGGAFPCGDDLVLSTERLNKIIEINEIDQIAITESGVITKELQNEISKYDLFFPQNISSEDISFIGGNIATSSGSPKSLKYGTTKNYVINLEVVLPNGEILWTGKNVLKNSSGYNLTQLFVGSEGTLGIITKVVVKLIPTKNECLLRIPFTSIKSLFDFVYTVFKMGVTPSSMEFLDRNGIDMALKYLNDNQSIENDISGFLWMEFDSERGVKKSFDFDVINSLITEFTAKDFLFAESSRDIRKLWIPRMSIGHAILKYSPAFKDFDFAVPRSCSYRAYNKINLICKEYKLQYIVIGHIGDGNFHLNILQDKKLNAQDWNEKVSKCLMKLSAEITILGGAISGEHGIGIFNKKYFQISTQGKQIELMKAIKNVFDPNNILNPNNIF